MLVIGSAVLNLVSWATNLGSALLLDKNKEVSRCSLELVTY